MGKKAQASFDMLLTFMIGISIILITVLYVNSAQTEYSDSYRVNAAQNTVNKIAEAADTIFLQEPSSKMVMTLYFPEGIKEAIVRDKIVMLKLRTSSGDTDIYQTTKQNVTGGLPTLSGIYKIVIEKIVIENGNMDNYVVSIGY